MHSICIVRRMLAHYFNGAPSVCYDPARATRVLTLKNRRLRRLRGLLACKAGHHPTTRPRPPQRPTPGTVCPGKHTTHFNSHPGLLSEGSPAAGLLALLEGSPAEGINRV